MWQAVSLVPPLWRPKQAGGVKNACSRKAERMCTPTKTTSPFAALLQAKQPILCCTKVSFSGQRWRRVPESNRCTRICNSRTVIHNAIKYGQYEAKTHPVYIYV